ncbi:type I-E CRISPR-associated protein Cse2/CasB [Segnochrobactraceae bacterium EtOH-i3]
MTDPVAAAPPENAAAPKKPAPATTLLGRQANAAFRWWASLQDDSPLADRRARAVLRRADPAGAIEEESVIRLYRALVQAIPAPGQPPVTLRDADRSRLIDRAMRLALVLPHVRANDGMLLARKLGGHDAKEAKLSPLRLRALLEARSTEDIVRSFRRAVTLADRSVKVSDLARLLLDWESDRTRTNFVFAFHAADDFSPARSDDD